MSIRSDLIQNIEDTLKTIRKTNRIDGVPYQQDLDYIKTEEITPLDQVDPDEFPIVFIIDGDENKEFGSVQSIECDLDIEITGYLKQNNDTDNLQLRRRKLMNDIEKALMQDQSRGNLAIKTIVSKISTDHGIFTEYSLFEMRVAINYFHDRKNPSSQDNI